MFKFWRIYWQLIKPYKRELIITLVWIGIVQAVLLIDPYLFKLILDQFNNWSEGSIKNIVWLIIAVLTTGILVTAVNNTKHRHIFRTILNIERDVPSRCMNKLLELSYGYHVRENTGAKMGKITRGTHKTIQIACDLLFDVIPILFEIIFVATILFALNWLVALIFLSAIPLYLAQVLFTEKRIGPLRRARHDNYEKADHMMTQAVINVQSVQSFVQERCEYEKFRSMKNHIFTNELAEWFWQINFDWFRSGAVTLGKVAVLATAVYQVTQDTISIGSLVLFLILSNKVYSSIYKLSRIYEAVADSSESVTRLVNILNEPVEVTSKKQAKKLSSTNGGITFDNVHFCYPNTVCGLHGVDLKIKPGEALGVCGPSGGGKSTLARLVPRFYDVCSGQVQLDGHNIQELDLDSFRRHIAIVPQEVEIFDGTVAENIAYARPGATVGEIHRAAKIANVNEFVDKLEDGYDTKVGERGLKLSGGQRQRVGIARAILADPAVLILDEATSHLDPISENLIHDSIAKLKGSLTMIIIAHRLSTIQNADRIIVLEDGKIVEEGTHQELLAKGGLYTDLATPQNGH